MSDVFFRYKQKRIYKTLAVSENFLTLATGDEIVAFWDNAFQESESFEEALERLKPKVSGECLKKLNRRYTKYKSAQKCRSENFSLNVSPVTGKKLSVIMGELGFDSYEEVIDYILHEQYDWDQDGNILR